MSRFLFSNAAVLALSIFLGGVIPAAHGHGGGHGGGGHGGGYGGHHGYGYGGYHGFGYGGYHGFHGLGYGYGYRGFGFGGFGYPGFGFSGFGFSGLGYGGLGYGGLGYGGLGYGGLGFGGLGFRGFGYGGYGYGRGYGYGGYGGFSSSCNCCCQSGYAYPSSGGVAPGYGGAVPTYGGSAPLPMPNRLSSASRYVDYYARHADSIPPSATAANTAPTRYMDYSARDGEPAAESKARLHVSLPADAELWLNGQRMHRTGAERDFITPQLQKGQTYAYQVKARWTQDGRAQQETIEVKVRADKTTTIRVGTASLAQR